MNIIGDFKCVLFLILEVVGGIYILILVEYLVM